MMNRNDSIVQQVNTIIIERIPNLIGIYLYGSLGTPYENKESDIDLAVLTATSISFQSLWQLSQEIAIKINKDVDLISLREASTVLCFQILTKGQRIYCSDQNKCDEFEMLAYSNYLRLNEERKEIIDAIKKRGQILDG